MYPHERSLVKKMDGKPFALIGVNSDKNREQLKGRMVEEKISWRSFWDGGMEGPIATAWNIQGWPTIYVLDHKGVIRAKDLRDKDLEKMVDELVKEAEASGARK